MNNLLSYSHHINSINQNLGSMSRTLVDLDRKYKLLDQKLTEMDSLILRLQTKVADIEATNGGISNNSSVSISDDRIRFIVKDYVDTTLTLMLTQTSTLPTTDQVNPLQDVHPHENVDMNIFSLEEQFATTNTDDIVIEEKKKKVGRKPKKTT